jgi:membrane protein YqaA with SNARE-associated domain
MEGHLLVYLGLFAAALAAATILRFQSEPALVGLLLAKEYNPWLSGAGRQYRQHSRLDRHWWLRRFIAHFEGRRWFPVRRERLTRAEAWYHRYGKWSLLVSWAPVVGDPLTVVAGVLREPFWSLTAIVTIAKTARYLGVLAITWGWM